MSQPSVSPITQNASGTTAPTLKPIILAPPPTKELEFRVGFNKFTPGRPRIAAPGSKWAITQSSAALLPVQPFENREGVCYRNSATQRLMNSRVFVDYLSRHEQCSHRACLRCCLKAIAEQYFDIGQLNQQILSPRLDELWQTCLKVFWGPRAQRKKGKVGTKDMISGGNIWPFILYLIREMQEQCKGEPS
jgi:hypothetical protein